MDFGSSFKRSGVAQQFFAFPIIYNIVGCWISCRILLYLLHDCFPVQFKLNKKRKFWIVDRLKKKWRDRTILRISHQRYLSWLVSMMIDSFMILHSDWWLIDSIDWFIRLIDYWIFVSNRISRISSALLISTTSTKNTIKIYNRSEWLSRGEGKRTKGNNFTYLSHLTSSLFSLLLSTNSSA